MGSEEKPDILDSLFDFIPLPFGDAPVEFCMAMPKSEAYGEHETGFSVPEAALPQAGRIASGRGFTAKQAKTSCRGELAELISSCIWDSDKLITSSYRDLGENAIHPNSILGFRDEQYASRDQWNAEHGVYDFVPNRFDEIQPVEWVEVKNLVDDKTCFVPAALVFIGYSNKADPGVYAVADSNGCATGETYESALESAFLELVERDATGLWWYGQRLCPRVNLDSIDHQPLKGLVDWCADRDRSLQVIDLTNDLEIPVYVAVSANPDGSHVYMGYGANYDVYRALSAALTEMLQIEFSGQTAQMFAQADPANEVQTPLQKWHDRVSLSNQPHLNPDSVQFQTIEICQNIKANEYGLTVLDAIERQVSEQVHHAWTLDMHLSDIQIPAVRIFVPGFSHYHARFGVSRLGRISEELTNLQRYLNDLRPTYTPLII
jgi:ribosomal protein S12 methylthiotransferase accessory factor